jgi:hypothetical protein
MTFAADALLESLEFAADTGFCPKPCGSAWPVLQRFSDSPA